MWISGLRPVRFLHMSLWAQGKQSIAKVTEILGCYLDLLFQKGNTFTVCSYRHKNTIEQGNVSRKKQ